jgi:hypothetical protein
MCSMWVVHEREYDGVMGNIDVQGRKVHVLEY